jgi:hypothetical protein
MTLTVIASVPIGAVAHPVEVVAALETLQAALDDAAMGPRPVSASREWGRLPRESEVERVAYRCTPTAFRATAAAWGSDVQGHGRFLVCERERLFADDTGKIDPQARDDFWVEAGIRDGLSWEGDDPDAFHCRAAESRERARRERKEAKLRPPATECRHDGPVDETPTFDGYLNRQCRACGEWLPCRKASAV